MGSIRPPARKSRQRQLYEPVPIEDTFCTELARVERLPGGAVRLVWAVEQKLYEADDAPILVVKDKLILQRAAFRAAAATLARRANVKTGARVR